jgi:hypothetical protein
MVIQAEVHHLLVKEAVAEEPLAQVRLLAQLQYFQEAALDIHGRIQEIPMLVAVVAAEVPRIQAALVALVVVELVAVLSA